MPRARTLLPVLLATIGLAIAGCASNNPPSGGAASGGSTPTVAFTSPTQGASVTSPVQVAFTVQGAKIGQPETGDMHLHVYVDQSSDYKILYATSGTLDVPAGKHTLKAVLAQPNHTETSTTASEQVDVTATGGAQEPATTSNYGYK